MANTTILEKIKSSGRFASVDAKWGPYASVAAAHAKLGEDGDDVAVIGLTVGVIEGNKIVEYWYQGGTALANLTRKTVSVDGELSPSSDNAVANEVLYEGFDNLGKDVTVVTAVGTEVTGGNKANLTAPSDYSAGTIFRVNSGVDGSNYSPFVDGILYYVALAAGSSGDSLEDNTKFYSTYSATDALSKRIDALNDDVAEAIAENRHKEIAEQYELLFEYEPDSYVHTIVNKLYTNQNYYIVVECSEDIANAGLCFSNGSTVPAEGAILRDGILRKGKNIFKALYSDEKSYFVTRPYEGITKVYFYLCSPSKMDDAKGGIESVALRSGIQKSSVVYPAKQGNYLNYRRLVLNLVCEGKISVRFNDPENIFSAVNVLVKPENDDWATIDTTTTACINTWKTYTLPYKITAISIGTGSSRTASADGAVSFDIIMEGSISARIDALSAETNERFSDVSNTLSDIEQKLQIGEKVKLSPSAIQEGKVIKTSGVEDNSRFDVYTYAIDSTKKYFIRARMNTGNTFFLVFYSEDAELQNIVGHEDWRGSNSSWLYVPSKDSGKVYELLSIPEGANYVSVNVRNTSATIDYLEVVEYTVTGEFNVNEIEQRLRELEQNGHGNGNDINSLYNNEEHEAIVLAVGKKVVNGRGDSDRYVDETQPQPLVLLHFSDSHGSSNFDRVMDYYYIYRDKIADIVNTGDLVSNYYEDGLNFFTSVEGHEKVLNVIGNHDTRKKNSEYDDNRQWSQHAGKDAYDTYIGPFVSNWGDATNPIVQPSDAATIGKCYYYKDYTQQKIRLIVIDNMVMYSASENYDANQITWFTDVLADALQNNMTVVGAMHFPNDGEVIESPFCAYGQTAGSGDWATAVIQQFYDAVDNFKQSGGQFACWIAGHKHSSVLGKAKNHSDQLIIAVGSTIGDGRGSWDRSYKSKNRDFFHLMGIDVNRKLVKVKQIGVEYDRQMRHRNVLCYNYETNTFITSETYTKAEIDAMIADIIEQYLDKKPSKFGDTLPFVLGGGSGQSTQLGEELPIELS